MALSKTIKTFAGILLALILLAQTNLITIAGAIESSNDIQQTITTAMN